LVLCALLLPVGGIRADEKPAVSTKPTVKTLGKGKVYETEYYELQGKLPGPTVLLEAGIHGNEPAGTLALEWLLPRLTVTRGRVLIFPRMHKVALGRKKRYLDKDLNKQFPGDRKSKVIERRLAAEIHTMVGTEKPNLVLTLHEARVHIMDGKCCAQTIIYGIDQPTDALRRATELVNLRSPDDRHRFQLFHYPIPTSSSEVFVRDFGLEAYCIETWLAEPMPRRVRSHLNAVTGFLEAYGIEFKVEGTYQE